MKVITCTSEKGGIGKTTTTANLAAELAERGNAVLLVDNDPQGNLTRLFGVERTDKTIGIAQLLDPTNPASLTQAIHPGVIPRVDLIPAVRTPLLAMARTLAGESVGREFFLRDALKNAGKVYDWIICDTKPDTEILTVNAMIASDGVIAVAEYDLWAAEGAATIAGLADKCARMLGVNTKFLGVLFNKVEGERVVTRMVGADIAATGLPVFSNSIAYRAVIKQANYSGMPVRLFEPRSESVAEYAAVTDEIIKRLGGDVTVDLTDTPATAGADR